MIQKVRKSFITITMTMLTLVLIIPLFAVNIVTAVLTYNNTHTILEQIAQTEVYILEPRDPIPDHSFPTENQNMGVVKPVHTTSTSTASSQTTTISITIATSVEKQSEAENIIQTLSPIPHAQTTTPSLHSTDARHSTDVRPDIPKTTPHAATTPPQPPSWQQQTKTEPAFPSVQTNPTRPIHPNHPAFTQDFRENEFENNNYKENESWYGDWNGWYAAEVPALNAKIAAAVANFISLETAQNSSIIPNSANSSTTYTTTVSQTFPPESPQHLSENTQISKTLKPKVFDKQLREPLPPDQKPPSSIDHFVVFLDKENNVTDVQGSDDFTKESCSIILQNIKPNDKYDGYYGSMQYVRKDYNQGAVMVFSDRQSDIKMMKTILFVSIGLFLLMEFVVFFITRILTKKAMRPMQISYEKQQQFISDAGHELKTPLTVISANADILADEIGDNKWLTYIKSQAERMRILVQEMLDLTKITSSDQHIAQSHFNISSLVENVALPFECQAFEQKKTFHIELEPNVEFFGNTERIRRMIGIFIDNAFKYSNENGTIKIQLKTESNKKILRIYNTGIGIAKGEEEKIFERFYRSDTSRSKQGGYGLGLAIAKSIADQHGIKINVQTEPNQWISFNLTL